jgi:hypothetical protein
MAEKIARDYIHGTEKRGMLTAFTYGNPKGSDVDLCIVSRRYEYEPAEGIDLRVLTSDEFEEKLPIFGKQAVEFRCLFGKEYLSETLKKLKLDIPVK